MQERKVTVEDCPVILWINIHIPTEALPLLKNNITLPFEVKRVFYLYDVPGGEERGGHSHYELHQFIIAVSGSFDVVIDDGVDRKTVTLNRPYYGLWVKPGIWSELNNFSSGAVTLVLASGFYDEADYIRDYEDFLKMRNK